MNSYFINSDVFIIPEQSDNKINLNNSADLLVVCLKEDYTTNSDLLDNILKAVGYSKDKNAEILALDEDENIHMSAIVNDQIKRVMCFGLKPRQIGMNAGFHANHFYSTETYDVLLTHSLSQMEQQTKFKKALWAALQNHFKSE